MTPDQASAYNKAIDDAVMAYKGGIGAIKALKVKQVVVVDHVGTTTKQEVVDLGEHE